MNAWTSAARDELNRFLLKIRQPLEQAGADAAEVIEDIRRHIDEEIAAARLRVVTVTELKPMLARIGEPWRKESDFSDKANAAMFLQRLKANREGEQDAGWNGGGTVVAEKPAPVVPPPFRPASDVPNLPNDSVGKQNGGPTQSNNRGKKKGLNFYHLFFGVLIPTATLGIEWVTGFCAKNIFNPIPTWGHIFLVALVPLMNLAAWWALRREDAHRYAKPLTFGLGAAIGVSIVYSIIYVPLILPGILALMFFGMGLLPLTPYLALITSSSIRSRVKETLLAKLPDGTPVRFWPGVLAAFAAFLLIDIPYVGTTAGMHMAANPATEKTGLTMLRTFAHEETVLRACYSNRGSSQFAPALFWLLDNYTVTTEQARKTYFQLYGRAFNSVPAPGPRRVNLTAFGAEPFDPERGGEKVGTPVPGLTLQASRMDATVEPRGALSYLEWIFEFNNSAFSQAEARCEIVLPPNAVVSRLTLWINGEEREAAFAGKSQVREAYQNVVVVQRRDPVLVTSSGKDRIMMQCFPVPVNGTMKVRVGMTIPLLLDTEKNGVLRWPYIRERNFALEETLEHSFWIDSSTPVETLSIPLKTERTASGHYMARGTLNERENSTIQPAVLIRRDSMPDQSWVRDTRKNDGSYVAQSIREAQRPVIRDLVLLVDGSASMGLTAEQLTNLNMVPGRSLRVVIAGSEPTDFVVDSNESLEGVLKKARFSGGQDNIPALERAWDLAAENGDGAVMWVHGPQPIALSSTEGLKQRFERRRNAVQIYDLPIERAPNAVALALSATAKYNLVSMHRAPVEVLQNLMLELSGEGKRFELARERVTGFAPEGAESNLHLARLWAYDEVQRLVRTGAAGEGIALAGLYQLVTEVSGAVVLETAEQYARAGLQPVSPQSVPMVPEPSTWALMIIGAVVLVIFRRRFRNAPPTRI